MDAAAVVGGGTPNAGAGGPSNQSSSGNNGGGTHYGNAGAAGSKDLTSMVVEEVDWWCWFPISNCLNPGWRYSTTGTAHLGTAVYYGGGGGAGLQV